MIEILFILSTILIIYIYFGYPVLIAILARIFQKPHVEDPNFMPSVTMVISAFNEEDVIKSKIENSLALDYPGGKIDIVIVSDCSTDKTDEIVRSYDKRGVRLIRLEQRQGKTNGLNNALAAVHTDIVVFSDANAMYESDALRYLVRHFADTNVGYVVGRALYEKAGSSSAGNSEKAYWNLELRLKQWESDFESVVGGDGAIYAIRKELYTDLEKTDINDFVNPLQIVAIGYRGIFESRAVCIEKTANDFGKEFNRKARIVNRSFNGLLRIKKVCNPFRSWRFAFEVISHKLLRWLSPFFLIVQFISALLLSRNGWIGLMGAMVIAFHGMMAFAALIGSMQDRKKTKGTRLLYFPYYFYLVMLASAAGIYKRIRGEVIVIWTPVRDKKSNNAQQHGYLVLLLVITVMFTFYKLIGLLISFETLNQIISVALVLLILYTFIGYPAAIWLIARFVHVKIDKEEDIYPSVTLLISAFNEQGIIREKLENTIELEYPDDRLKVVVASDGSTDKTNDIVKSFESNGIELLSFSENRGKISIINDAMKTIQSEIVVFSDANVMFEPTAIKMLVRNFKDARVGGVSGKVYLLNGQISYGASEQLYYSIEHFIQEMESKTGALVGADGAMYAIRRDLYIDLPAATVLDDFVISINIVNQGYSLVHEKKAIGFENNCNEADNELKRKIRIIAGGIQYMLHEKAIPMRKMSLLAFKIFSHKILRWLVGPMVFCLLAIAVYEIFTSETTVWFGLLLLGIFGSVGISLCAHWLPALRRKLILINMLHYLFLLIFGSLIGCFYGLTGKQKVTWKKDTISSL
jgi:cellulose synthase/poly-beta-1,6-N-acetylglucosamine synthase-like glycosyltransferase